MITYLELSDDKGQTWTWDGTRVFKNGEEEDYSFDAEDFDEACAYLIDTGFFYKKLKHIIDEP